ncbi:HaaA family cyclophane-containing RiPP peptide [Streptomyces monticola]|uniref:HaaA family cyclophane-containing RiPP peptide n=1 Tax=Streptomyces monticola TaxID=2666263 RepID=A0ABW2JBV7_9ACTN
MSSQTPGPAQRAAVDFLPRATAQGEASVVLDRVAARVQARLAAEGAQLNPSDSPHPASLTWPWPI